MMDFIRKVGNASPVMIQYVLLVIQMVLTVKKLVKLDVLYVLLLKSVLLVKLVTTNLQMLGIVWDVIILSVLLAKILLINA